MELLSMSLTLCTLLTLSRASPVNYTMSMHMGLCKQHSQESIGAFVPRCDANGNFLPQQCWGSTGYCWCVNVITGEEIPNTSTPPGATHVNCDKQSSSSESEEEHGGHQRTHQTDKQSSSSESEEEHDKQSSSSESEEEHGGHQHTHQTDKQSSSSESEEEHDKQSSSSESEEEHGGHQHTHQTDKQSSSSESEEEHDKQSSSSESEEEHGGHQHTHQTDSNIYCPHGWSRFGKRCFIFIDSPKTWAEAENYCLFEGANLASIHSGEENRFIQDLTRGDSHDFPETWIGGYDAIHDSFWMWSDGSMFNYENWYNEYEMEKTEDCLEMNHGFELKWNSDSCNETHPSVCAKMI